MLLSESDVNIYNADSILNEVVLLDESESITKLPAIPVVENSRLGGEVVNLSDLDNIVEDYDCSYEDAFYNIAEQNELDPSNLMVAVEDYSIIETPELVDLVPNIVIKPISENNIVYQAVDYCIDEYCNTGDEGYLDYLDEVTQDWIEKKIGGNYKRAKENREYIYSNNRRIADPDTDDDSRKAFKDLNKKWNKILDRPILFDSDKEKQKAEKKGYSTRRELLSYVDNLKMRARHNARNVKRYGTPNPPAKPTKRPTNLNSNQTSTSTNTSKALTLAPNKKHNENPARLYSPYSRQENIPIPKTLSSGEARKKEESKKIASNRKEEKQQAANNTASSANTSKALALVPGQTRTSNHGTTVGKAKRTNNPNHLSVESPDKPSGSLPPSTIKAMTVANGDNNHNSFLSNHKKAIGVGAAGLIGAALAARKIAALRKQQQKHPGLRGKLQAIINRLKSKLRR